MIIIYYLGADEGETVIMDATESKNYNMYWLAMHEQTPGDGPNRWRFNGWTDGILGVKNLSTFWDGGIGWNFLLFGT